jgi:peroxiredoxin
VPRVLSRRLVKQLRTGLATLALAGMAALGAAHLIDRGELAPVVDYTELDGSRHRSDELLGRVVLVNFWATSCTVCVHEMPKLIQTHERLHSRGLQMLAVAMSYDPPAYVVNYAQSRQLPFAVVIDNTGEIARQFGKVQLTPTTFVIDKRGHIVRRITGEPDFDQLEHQLLALLSQS